MKLRQWVGRPDAGNDIIRHVADSLTNVVEDVVANSPGPITYGESAKNEEALMQVMAAAYYTAVYRELEGLEMIPAYAKAIMYLADPPDGAPSYPHIDFREAIPDDQWPPCSYKAWIDQVPRDGEADRSAVELGRSLVEWGVSSLLARTEAKIQSAVDDLEYMVDALDEDWHLLDFFEGAPWSLAKIEGWANIADVSLTQPGGNTYGVEFKLPYAYMDFTIKSGGPFEAVTYANAYVTMENFSLKAGFTTDLDRDWVTLTLGNSLPPEVGFRLDPGTIYYGMHLDKLVYDADMMILVPFWIRIVNVLWNRGHTATEAGGVLDEVYGDLILWSEYIQDKIGARLPYMETLPPPVENVHVGYNCPQGIEGTVGLELDRQDGRFRTELKGLELHPGCKPTVEFTGNVSAVTNWTYDVLLIVLARAAVNIQEQEGQSVTKPYVTDNGQTVSFNVVTLGNDLINEMDISPTNTCKRSGFNQANLDAYFRVVKSLFATKEERQAAERALEAAITSNCNLRNPSEGLVLSGLQLQLRMMLDTAIQGFVGAQLYEHAVEGPLEMFLSGERMVPLDQLKSVFTGEPGSEDVLGNPDLSRNIAVSFGSASETELRGGVLSVSLPLGVAWNRHRPNYGAQTFEGGSIEQGSDFIPTFPFPWPTENGYRGLVRRCVNVFGIRRPSFPLLG